MVFAGAVTVTVAAAAVSVTVSVMVLGGGTAATPLKYPPTPATTPATIAVTANFKTPRRPTLEEIFSSDKDSHQHFFK
jgi:hypothetical protein